MLAILLVAPWPYGLAEWQTQLHLVHAVLAVFLCAIIAAVGEKKRIAPLRIELILGAFVAFASIQSIPFHFSSSEATTLQQIALEIAQSSGLKETPALHTAPGISINTVQTQASNSVFAAAVLFLYSTRLLFSSFVWRRSLVVVLAFNGVLIGILGLLQASSRSEWTLIPMGGAYFSTFPSRSTACDYLAITLGCWITLFLMAIDKKSSRKTYLREGLMLKLVDQVALWQKRQNPLSTAALLSIILVSLACLAANSRGGTLAVTAAALTIPFGLARTRTQFAATVGLIVLLLPVAFSGLFILELDENVLGRLETIQEESDQLDNSRFELWDRALSMREFWSLGCGLGNFHFAILPTYQGIVPAWFYHAENLYVEAFVEFGVIGAVLALALLVSLRGDFRSRWSNNRPLCVGVSFALLVCILHSLTDFSLIVPGVFLSIGALTSCVLACREQRSESTTIKTYLSSSSISAIALFLVTLQAIVFGHHDLRGYAFADSLAISNSSEPKIDGDLVEPGELLDLEVPSSFSNHPEVRLAAGRIRQHNARVMALRAEWPEAWSSATKMAFAQPELLSAALRTTDSTNVKQLREVLQAAPEIEQLLLESRKDFELSSANCGYDFRSAWGWVRGNATQGSSQESVNMLRIATSGQINPRLQVRYVTAAGVAGDYLLATACLRHYLNIQPSEKRLKSVEPLIGTVLQAETILNALPESELRRIEFAKLINGKFPALASQIIKDVDIEKCIKLVDSKTDWPIIYWLAEAKQNLEQEIFSLSKMVKWQPMNINYRFRLAKKLEAAGQIEAAIREAAKICRMAPGKTTYEDYLQSLKAMEKNR